VIEKYVRQKVRYGIVDLIDKVESLNLLFALITQYNVYTRSIFLKSPRGRYGRGMSFPEMYANRADS
jgi:precorrin-2 dehydrogenase/sirohydrochlorin ferrochelatase